MGKLFVVIMLFAPSIVLGQTYLQTDEWERAATKKLVKELKASAKNGDGEAAFGLGNLFFNGLVIKEDYDEALKWYELAVDNGYKKAKEQMGDVQMKMLEVGLINGKLKDMDALSLAVAIGNCYVSAITYYQNKTDKKRVANKILRIGEFEHQVVNGNETIMEEMDNSSAISYYKLAARNGSLEAASWLGLFYENRKDFKQAIQFFELAADEGDFISQARAGEYYYEGKRVTKDTNKSFKYTKLACLNLDEDDVVDFIEAQEVQSGGIMHRLAACYRYGIGTTANAECAEYWDILSALYGDTAGQEILTFNGLNINKDDPNIWQSVFLKFQPVLQRASANNTSAQVLYYIALTNSKDVSMSSQAINKLASLIDGNTLDDVTKAFVCDFLFQLYNEAAKVYTNKKDFLVSEAKKFAQKRKEIEVEEIALAKWFLNTIRLSMRVF